MSKRMTHCDAPEGMRTCKDCFRVLPLEENFYRNKEQDSWQWDCKLCVAEKRSIWRSEDPDRQRNYNMKKYGIDMDDYRRLLESQGGVCGICKRNPEDCNRGLLFIDHDHLCEEEHGRIFAECIRGLICQGCNNGLGAFGDSIAFLWGAIEYLENYQSGKP